MKPASPKILCIEDDVETGELITEELVRRGYGERTIKKVLGGNLLRVMRAVEAAAGK